MPTIKTFGTEIAILNFDCGCRIQFEKGFAPVTFLCKDHYTAIQEALKK